MAALAIDMPKTLYLVSYMLSKGIWSQSILSKREYLVTVCLFFLIVVIFVGCFINEPSFFKIATSKVQEI